jgi:hypothetical protein|tara:strand:+ start:1707 stop:1808 length:102 start_codon:yes stop_codon:yes gene_type:complete
MRFREIGVKAARDGAKVMTKDSTNLLYERGEFF